MFYNFNFKKGLVEVNPENNSDSSNLTSDNVVLKCGSIETKLGSEDKNGQRVLIYRKIIVL